MDKVIKATRFTLAGIGLLMIAAGVLVFCIPDSVSWIVGVLLFIVGAANIIFFAKDGRNMVFSGLFLTDGIVDILLGILFCRMSAGVTTVLTVLFSILLILLGFTALAATGIVRKFAQNKAWIGMLVLGIAAIILGIIAITNPGGGQVGQIIFSVSIAVILILIGVAYFVLDYRIGKASRSDSEEDVGKYFRDVDD